MKALAFILSFPAIILHGWVLSLLWRWFFVPTFGLPVLRLVEAIGIALVVRFLIYVHPEHALTDEKLVEYTIAAYTFPLIMLGFGWIVRSFM
ncbi:hypothetical protein ES703_08220 [subsurface metagenome]